MWGVVSERKKFPSKKNSRENNGVSSYRNVELGQKGAHVELSIVSGAVENSLRSGGEKGEKWTSENGCSGATAAGHD